MQMTNFPNGLQSMGVPLLGGQGIVTSGDAYFVDPKYGDNGNDGMDIKKPLADVETAYNRARDGYGDVIYLLSNGGTSSSDVTSYLTSQLEWAKDRLHLIGLAAPTEISPRARIAAQTSTGDVFEPVLKISAHGCIFANFQVYMGVESNTNATGAIEVTGERNYFRGVHAAGIGHTDNDVADAYSLKLNGGGENLFENCTIGIDTISRGSAANSELVLANTTDRNKFRSCTFRAIAEAAGHQFIMAGENAIRREVMFENCFFHNPEDATGGTEMTEAIDINSTQEGIIVIRNSTLVGAADWEAGDEGLVYIDGAAPTAGTSGIGVATTA